MKVLLAPDKFKGSLPAAGVAAHLADGLRAGQARAAGLLAVDALTDLEPDVARCIAEAGALLERLAPRIVADLAPAPGGRR